MDFSELLAGLGGEDAAEEHSVAPEAALVTLREIAVRFTAPVPFNIGDAVTPRRGYNHRSEGAPHIVVALGDRSFMDDGSGSMVTRRDVAAVCLRGSQAVPVVHWFDAYVLEPYAEPRS